MVRTNLRAFELAVGRGDWAAARRALDAYLEGRTWQPEPEIDGERGDVRAARLMTMMLDAITAVGLLLKAEATTP
jgi:hypothetical protein